MGQSGPSGMPYVRETVVVNGVFAMRAERLRAAREGATGRQVLTVELMAQRMAGGFLRMARPRDVRKVLSGVLSDPHLRLGELDAIKDLPGMARAAASTLMKLWLARLDLDDEPEIRDHPRMQSLMALEQAVLSALPPDTMPPQDLISLACARARHAPRIFGRVVFRGMTELHPAWRPLLFELSRYVPIVWDCGPRARPPDWIAAAAEVRTSAPENPEVAAETAASPRHEAVEALRWARRLVTEEGIHPGDIAIAAASTSAYDDHFVALKAETDLPLHIAHGVPAIGTRDGQAAAALADVLLRGLSQKRVRRLVELCGLDEGRFADLPADWTSHFREDAGLATVELWERALERLPKAARTAEVLLPVIRLLGEGTKEAEKAGREILRGRALEIWNEALVDGPAGALDATLKARNVPDREDFSSSVCYMSAEALAASPRPYVRLIGLSSRSWPRGHMEDALIPDRLVPSRRLDPLPASEADVRDFWTILATAARQVVLSWPRRDADGRAVGVSSLVGELDRKLRAAGRDPALPGLREGAAHLRRVRVPGHAFSESDRLTARAFQEFAATPLAKSALACWADWHKEEATPHDGLIRSAHPRIETVFSQYHSATSIRHLLRDPLGFVWKYALGFDAHETEDAPLFLDARAFGNIVHDILQRAVKSASQAGGFASIPEAQLRGMVETAASDAGRAYEIANPVPPRLVWESSMRTAAEFAFAALTAKIEPLPGQRSYVEVPFGGGREWMPDDVPWDPYAEVRIPGSGLKLHGVIDRVDLAASHSEVRVVDYKTGKTPKALIKLVLDGGRELQRCIYGYAVKSLLGNVKVEAGLLYPGTSQYAPVEDLDGAMEALAEYVSRAKSAVDRGLAVPGIDSADRYNDLLFALPANAKGTYLARKRLAFQGLLGDVADAWEAA